LDLVIDANILFATFVKAGITARLFFLDRLHLFSPEFLLEEFAKYEGEIRAKTHRDARDFEEVLATFRNRLTFIAKADAANFLEDAKKISPDPKDVPYLAVAMKLGISIWSNDKHLKEQGRVKIYATHDLLKLLVNP
jgi:predicted nucleic acid-binding protein